jgi:hypothetical protein
MDNSPSVAPSDTSEAKIMNTPDLVMQKSDQTAQIKPSLQTVATNGSQLTVPQTNTNSLVTPNKSKISNTSPNTIAPQLQPTTAEAGSTTPTIDGPVEQPNGYQPQQNIVDVNATIPSGLAGPDIKGEQSITSILNKLSMADDKEYIDSLIKASPVFKVKINNWRRQLIKAGLDAVKVNSLDVFELKKELEDRKLKY